MLNYSWISVMAVMGYLFLLIAFASAKKTKVIDSFMLLLVILIAWSGGSFLMRIRFWPSVNFWHYVSIGGIMMVPFGFLQFFLDFLEEKRKFGKNFWLLFFVSCFIVNLITQVFIPTPEMVVTKQGEIQFLYTYGWPVYIIFGACVIIMIQIVQLFFCYCRGDQQIAKQLRPILLGIAVVTAGNIAATWPVFAGFPIDIISCVVFAYCLFYALYQKRIFKLTLLASRGNCYIIAVAIVVLLFYNGILPLRNLLEQKLHVKEEIAILMIVLLMIGIIFLVYRVMKRFLDHLFVKEEQIHAEIIKQFSYTVSKSLNKEVILTELVDVIRTMTGAARVYVCIENRSGAYVLERSSSMLETKQFQMDAEHPLVQYMKKQESCVLLRDFKRTNQYRAMWEKEKQQLEQWNISCLVPMKDSSDLVGIVMLTEKEQKKQYSVDDFGMLLSVNSICSMAVKNSRLYELAYDEARKDELTGLYNRKSFYEQIHSEFEKCLENSIALVMINVDDFKLYNQLYGTNEGDVALKKIAEIMLATTADRGMVFRMTGKEFSILLPHYDLYSAKVLAESVAEQVCRMNDHTELYSMKVLTLSCGICAAPYLASSVEELITNTDLAVYSAKRAGKNTVVMFSEDVQNDQPAKEYVSYYDTYAPTIYALTAAIDTKDHYTFSHSQNVAYYAGELARKAGMNQECISTVREAGLLHDIGKIGIAERILNKPGKLTEQEYEIMKTHVENSIGIIRHLPSLDYVIPAVLAHHERYDGGGYPRGVSGEDIPLMGRILCVADSFDAMISRRSYKHPMEVEQALAILASEKGKQFDPRLADLFIGLVRKNELTLRFATEERGTCAGKEAQMS